MYPGYLVINSLYYIYNEDISLIDALKSMYPAVFISLFYCLKQKEILLLYPTISILDAYRMLLYLSITLETIDISEAFFVHTLVNFRATKTLVNKASVDKHKLNTYRLSQSISIYNVNSTSNEMKQISKVVDMVLHYKFYLEQILLVVSSLDK